MQEELYFFSVKRTVCFNQLLLLHLFYLSIKFFSSVGSKELTPARGETYFFHIVRKIWPFLFEMAIRSGKLEMQDFRILLSAIAKFNVFCEYENSCQNQGGKTSKVIVIASKNTILSPPFAASTLTSGKNNNAFFTQTLSKQVFFL